MTSSALARLSTRDWGLLRDLATCLPFRRGDTILEEGDTRRALMLIRTGAVRVQRTERGTGITIAQLGAGEIFGEMGFVENAPASASVMAETDGSVDVIEAEALQSVMASEPGFAVRFYHSIAITLARRLRRTSRRLAQTGASEAAQLNRFRHTRTGNISSRQMPSELVAEVEAFGQAILTAEQALKPGRSPDAVTVQGAVSAACDSVLAALDRFTGSTPLIDIGLDDLLAFRDTEQLETGVGDYVFRETFPTFMLSTTMARCYAKPQGYPDDFETIATIYRSDPEGDGQLGPAIDRWFLDRPISRARRAGRDHIKTMLTEEASVFQARGVAPRIASLASGAAAELLDICRLEQGRTVLATCVDLDSDALVAAASRAEAGKFADRVTFLQGNVLPVEGEGASLVPQHVIYALGLGEYLTDEQFLALLDRSFENLTPGGTFVISNLAAGHPDHLLMEHILDWHTEGRTEQQLMDLVRRSRFGTTPHTMTYDETGVSIYFRCTRPA
ncbi:cyclic nucleotide-binding domain-containing protein [Aurantimonas sp. VKM B-3413]|uniref:cyclic nucleotide-binding domain-containing protein n=1 Tax=Aurantimonas sp. VKM B-3413 TaxID=2779401 RepID=UPI001E495AA8|nr:cyclic nucleotide-binding domain-containing protein [Aurantimonas sp. VKM B-3413]MCB8839418.1 cyclic nucleotide-binding domain-containing protein [Aurantimonas sp. VKM B-3413]